MLRTPILRRVAFLWLLMLIAGAVAAPSFAHKQHKKKQEAATLAQAQAQAQAQASAQAGAPSVTTANPQAMHEGMSEMMTEEPDRSDMGLLGRLLDWLGRTHPVIVHFPIAFFPAALFTAVVGRRRPGFATPVQFLVVAGGIIAPISALLGWFNGGFSISDTDPLMMAHRWLGTAIGVGGLALGIWAWRRPWEDRGAGMIAALTTMTIAIAVQGWFGGALVHGVEHLSW
jgi:uncharacterized membrane protein